MEVDYSKFTNKSRDAISKAFSLTKQCQYAEVEPQLMMVAILQEGNEMIPFMLNNMNVDKGSFLTSVSNSMRMISHRALEEHHLSQSLQQVLQKSCDLALSDGNNVVALEYIFWALGEVDNPIKDIMTEFGINSEKLRQAVHLFRSGTPESPSINNVDEENFPNLYKYGRNLILAAENGEIEAVIGRDEEIRRILQIISRKTKNNPVLIGEPGTGKTAIVEGLANRITRGEVPQELKELKLFSVDIASLIAGAQMQGEFENRLKKVIEEAKSDPNVILFIDEIHLLMGAGKSGGAMDAANILKPEMARGVLKIIGATTVDEYRQYIEKDKAFERRFQKVNVEEPDIASAVSIMRGIKSRFENHHHIKILDEAIVAAVNLSHRYITNRFLPDKAIDLVDEAASNMRINQSSLPHDIELLKAQIRYKEVERESLIQDGSSTSLPNIQELEQEIENLKEQENVLYAKWQNERRALDILQELMSQLQRLSINRETAELQGRYADAVELQRQETAIKTQIDSITTEINSNSSSLLKTALDEKDIMKVVTAWTGIPMTNMTEDDNEKLLHIEEALHASVVGQESAVKAVSDAIRRNRLGLNDPGKPIGTFLFLGTTGVGKTELCKALAGYLFNSRDMIIRIDMSEYQQEHSVSRLFGAPPGYVGYDAGGQLTEAVRRKPYSVVLFDEIEKAHPKVFETLLQVLDDGRMTDGQGRVIDFKNTIIVMTSNMGQDIINQNLIGCSINQEKISATSNLVIMQLKQRVAPEFLNRIDDIIMFLPLTPEDIKHIVTIQLSAFKDKLNKNNININFDDSVIALLSIKGYKPEYGGRPVKRVIKDYIIDNLSLSLLRQEIDKTMPIQTFAINEQISFSNELNN